MNEHRCAILIGNNSFPEEERLDELRCPVNDVDGMREVLDSKELGGFNEIHALINETSHKIRKKINEILNRTGKDDLVLIYYSGHGKLNRVGKLCLAANDTVMDALDATSVRFEDIKDFLDTSKTKKVVLLLDCCFSGAAGAAFNRSGVDDQLQLAQQGRGVFLMTASTGLQVAQEKEADDFGVFTKHVVEGIRSGKADLDGDGLVTIDELYDYVQRKVKDEGHQQPMKWDMEAQGRMIISRSRKHRGRRAEIIEPKLKDLADKNLIQRSMFHEAMLILMCEENKLSDRQKRLDKALDLLEPDDFIFSKFTEKWYEISLKDKKAESPPEPVAGPQTDKPADGKPVLAPPPKPQSPSGKRFWSRNRIIGLIVSFAMISLIGVIVYPLLKPKQPITPKPTPVKILTGSTTDPQPNPHSNDPTISFLSTLPPNLRKYYLDPPLGEYYLIRETTPDKTLAMQYISDYEKVGMKVNFYLIGNNQFRIYFGFYKTEEDARKGAEKYFSSHPDSDLVLGKNKRLLEKWTAQ